MREQATFALVVHDESVLSASLKDALNALGVKPYGVQTCEEAKRLVDQTKPELVFTGSRLSDGSWSDILEVARTAEFPPNVIVVGATTDTNFYLSVMEHGAFDFIVPPFEHESLAFIVKSAEHDFWNRRRRRAHAAVA